MEIIVKLIQMNTGETGNWVRSVKLAGRQALFHTHIRTAEGMAAVTACSSNFLEGTFRRKRQPRGYLASNCACSSFIQDMIRPNAPTPTEMNIRCAIRTKCTAAYFRAGLKLDLLYRGRLDFRKCKGICAGLKRVCRRGWNILEFHCRFAVLVSVLKNKNKKHKKVKSQDTYHY